MRKPTKEETCLLGVNIVIIYILTIVMFLSIVTIGYNENIPHDAPLDFDQMIASIGAFIVASVLAIVYLLLWLLSPAISKKIWIPMLFCGIWAPMVLIIRLYDANLTIAQQTGGMIIVLVGFVFLLMILEKLILFVSKKLFS